MILRLLAESLRRGGRRKLLAFAVVVLGVASATAVAAVLVASGDRLAAEIGSYGANLEVLPLPGHDTFAVAGLSELRQIFWRNNIVAMAPLLPLRVRFEAAAGQRASAQSSWVAPLVGTWFDRAVDEEWRTGLPATRPTLEIDGRWPADGVPEGGLAEVAVGRRLAARLGVAAGETVVVELGERRRRLAVVGIVTSGGQEEERAFTSLSVVEALAGRSAGTAAVATRAEVFALTNPEPHGAPDPATLAPEEYERWYCTAYPSSVAFQIDEALPDARAQVLYGITTATADVLGKLREILLVLAAVVLLGAAMGVTAVMTTSMMERRLEAGLLLALGAESWKVVLFFISEAAVVGLVGGGAGGLAGLAAGRLLGRAIFDVAVPWAPILLPGAVAAGALVAVAGALVPVVRVFRERPALALKEAVA